MFELPEAEATVRGDPGLLHRAVINLLTRAIKYGKPQDSDTHTTVEVSITDQGKHWGIAVRDHGPGMDEVSLARLSQPFERLRSNTNASMALVWACTRTLAQRHGGRLLIQSQLGQGSTFTLLIPKAWEHFHPPDTKNLRTFQF
ncbi:ATP-binding protein [Staphylococcus epidermidis]|nr:ATP-binding protein [Staphylococcus epidermidis]